MRDLLRWPGPQSASVAIAHRAGNDRRTLQAAIDAGADWVEADVWWQYSQLVARHERALWRLPIRYDEWKLGIALRPALRLEHICNLLEGGPQLLIDFKGSARRLPLDVVETLRQHGATERAAICGQCWPMLDAARAREPALRAFYSLGTEAHLAALRERRPDLPKVAAVSCAEFLLTPNVIAEFLERELTIVAWTVNDIRRAQALIAAGVSGITTDSAAVLAAVRDIRPSFPPYGSGRPPYAQAK
jgi:glycerophosphoryl diester phosphodiesterase